MSSRYADLAALCGQIRAHDTDYPARYRLILAALAEASRLGLPCGIGYDNKPSAVPGLRIVVYIDLPGHGQVSWHMPEYPGQWDRHGTPTKLRRLERFAAEHVSPAPQARHADASNTTVVVSGDGGSTVVIGQINANVIRFRP
ncbi:hypothetical protein HDA40_004160 [Hamadaea flava]|uniref:Uncharacterized protein n=1 Tax=Hamadaea flava TaxID=1742688 RepID=A0ABV8LGW7_9ACTN|nr:hypothetical protein [Hamadaea flava]MCP2325653.1 hypothetical protein [Hamadaea flava]